MRRIFAIILILLLLAGLGLTASAATSATRVEAIATVSTDGSCQVSLSITLNLDSSTGDLRFPIPGNARNVSVGGGGARTSRNGTVLEVDLRRAVGNVSGTFAVSIVYTIPNAVALTEVDGVEKLMLTVPLLSGFDYPVEELRYTVNLPGSVTAHPTFSSTYFQANIEEIITYELGASSISGYTLRPMKDQESLSLLLEVPETQFPQNRRPEWTVNIDDIAMTVCAVAALLYWLVFLRCLPPRRVVRAAMPDGLTAGDLGSVITGQGADLTMLVLTWAQLGYVLIHADDNGRVILHKRMDMGNERSAFENRIFKMLFGKRRMIDGTGYHYAQLCRKVAAKPAVPGIYRRVSGNPVGFRVLAALIGLFGGVSLGNALGGTSILAPLVILVLAAFGFVSAWLIQEGGRCLHLRDKTPLYLALGLLVPWLLLGLLAGELNVAAMAAGAQLLVGIMAFYGGRRTDLGRMYMAQALGLRRFLKTIPRGLLQKQLRADPDYFYSLAPAAAAMGVDMAFAKRLGPARLGECPYLISGMDGHLSAAEWTKVLRQTVDTLDARQKRMLTDQLLGK